jgi:hypothetical protein
MSILTDGVVGLFNLILLPLTFLLYIFNYLVNLIYDWELLKSHIISLLFIIAIYCLFGYIYCWIFQMTYFKFFKGTIFPIIGFFILIIQGIIYIFFIPYHIYITLTETFNYVIKIIVKLYEWIYNIVMAFINMEDYLLNDV